MKATCCRFLSLIFSAAALGTLTAQVPNTLKYSIPAPPVGVQSSAALGSSVAVDGAYAVAGAPYDDTGGESLGVVKVFNSTTGTLLFVLPDPNPRTQDRFRRDNFGTSVAISGTRVVVGAPNDDTGTTDAGSAYVYDLSSATPTAPILTLHNPILAVDGHFGWSVAVSGTRVVVGVPGDSIIPGTAGRAYVYDLGSATPTVPVLALSKPGPASVDAFGISVAVSGTRVVVGASQDSTGASNAGSAYVFDLSSVTPTVPVVTLNNPGPAADDRFGISVAISGTRVVVGAHQDDTGASDAGSAYVYDVISGTPTVPIFILNNPGPADFDLFGYAVAISGTRVVIGTARDDTGAADAGSAYVYDLGSATPTVPMATLNNPNPADFEHDYFGSSVAISGARVVVGAPGDYIGVTQTGSVYVYDLSSGAPTVPVATLNNPGPSSHDQFGYAVAISGSRMVVGANRDNTGAEDAGSVYVYDLTSGTPSVPTLVLNNPAPEAFDEFGYSVAISGLRVVVGAWLDDSGASNSGIAYVYDLGGATPSVPVATLNKPNPSGNEKFGTSVAISGSWVVVGSPYDNSGASGWGRAYVYDLSSVTPAVPLFTLNNPNSATGGSFGWSVATTGTWVVVGDAGDDTGAEDAGSAYIYNLASGTPTVPVFTLRDSNPSYRASFGNSVAISGTNVVVGAPLWSPSTGITYEGSAFVYNLGSGTPTVPVATFRNPSLPFGAISFGSAVAISGTRIVVGEPQDSTGETEEGSAFVYDLSSGTPTVPVATLHNPGPAEWDDFGYSVAIDGTTVAIGTPFDYSILADKGAAYVFAPGATPAAQMVSPAADSTLSSTTTTFNWDTGTGVTSYSLWVGSTLGGYDLYAGNEGTNHSKTLILPDDGRRLYVTLHSLISGAYQNNKYTYTAWRAPTPVKAQIASPLNGSALASTSLPLVWGPGVGVTSYYLFVGTSAGGHDIYAGDQGTGLSKTVTVPADKKVYVTLWSLIKGTYQSSNYVFNPVPAVRASLASPASGSTITGNQLNLTWNAGTGVSGYYIFVGSAYGGYDLGAVNAGTANAWNFTVPQDGGPIYVTLYSLINGGYQAENYWFNTALPVSGSRQARITSPANTSTLGSATMNLTWDAGSGVTSYALWVGSTPNGYDLYSGLEGTNLSKNVAIPGDGRRVHVTLHSLISGAYQSNSYWFTTPTLPDGGAAQVTSPVNGSTLADATLPLVWSSAAGATQYYIFMGSWPGASDLYAGSQGTALAHTVTGMPVDGRAIYVTLYSWLNGAWKQSTAWFTTANTVSGNRRALMTSPVNGTTLPSASTTFTWGGGVGVTSYALWIGSSAGAYDLWSSAETLATTSRTVTLPTDGRKLYVTLYSFIGGAWQGASYLYTASSVAVTKAAMTSPASGSTFTGASQTFSWSASNAATMYALWIGRTPGGYDIYAGAEGTNTSRTVTTLPTDGSPVYVTLYSLIKGTWQSNEYIYNAALPP